MSRVFYLSGAVLLLGHIVSLSADKAAAKQPLQIWYAQEAVRWLEGVPVGNGRLGAVAFGGVEREQLALNESTCWSGSPSETNANPEGVAVLDEARRLLFADQVDEARKLTGKMLGRKQNYGTHLPLGNLFITFDHGGAEITDYRRELDLDSAVASVTYRAGNTHYTRELLATHVDQVLVQRLTANQPASLTFRVSLNGNPSPYQVRTVGNDTLELTGNAYEKMHSDGKTGVAFLGLVKVIAEGGDVKANESTIEVTGANSATFIVAIGTDLYGNDARTICQRQIEAAVERSYDEIRRDHVADHSALFRRVTLDLGGEDRSKLPTDLRLAELKQGISDPALDALFFQYGRYLIIASSRHDSPVPNNLQGIWGDGLAAAMPWTCDFHLDINTQMNYWPAEVTNLSECHDALFHWIDTQLVPSGRRTARAAYDHEGWLANPISNAWGYSAAGWGHGWGIHVTGGAWISLHYWDRYAFTGDREFLEKRAYPVLKEAVLFFQHHLVEHPEHGWLVSGPTVSPENSFYTADGQRGAETMGPTCDRVLVHELLKRCIEASEILQVDEELRSEWRGILERLPPLQIGKHGQLQEWLKDYDEAVPQHRHTTHLLSLYPYSQITPQETPELAEAARTVLERKVAHPKFEAVEWNLAWFISFYARLLDGEKAHQYLSELLTDATETNLFTFSAAGIAQAETNIMVIDGNTGATAGMAEMLLQSHRGVIDLLPALPQAWPTGSASGLCARGGFVVDMKWEQGQLSGATVTSRLGNKLMLGYKGMLLERETEQGEVIAFGAQELKSASAEFPQLQSPDGNINVTFKSDEKGHPKFSVSMKQESVITDSTLGLTLTKDSYNFVEGLQLKGSFQDSICEPYIMKSGKRLSRYNHCNQVLLQFENASGVGLSIVFRAYNDGIAYRYELDSLGKQSVVEEASEFRFGTIANIWSIPFNSGDEHFFSRASTATVENKPLSFPVLVETTSGTWGLVSESNVSSFPLSCGMLSGQAVEFVFATDTIAKNSVGPRFESPWRVVILGENLAPIVQSCLIDHLAPASKEQELPWVEAGIASFPWWGDNLANSYPERLKRYIDLSVDMNWRYIEFDVPLIGSPSRAINEWKTTPWIKEVVDYGLERGVLCYGWDELRNLNTPERRDKIFTRYKELGLRGIKVDFVNSYTQETRTLVEELIQDAMRFELMVSFHGAQSPRGFARTYPHVMTFEAVRGSEYYLEINGSHVIPPEHNCILPFTRNVLGSMDYTPVAFSSPIRETTRGHELALSIVFESGWQGMCDMPESYLNSEARTLLELLPAAWDETIFLDGYPGAYCCLARRKGDRWFVAGINAGPARNVSLNLPFVASGPVQVYTDSAREKNKLEVRQVGVESGQALEITMESNGGFAFTAPDCSQ